MRWLERFLCGLVGHASSTLIGVESTSAFCLHCGKDLT